MIKHKKENSDIDFEEIIVSVIIVTYNDELIIDKILNQLKEVFLNKFPNFEILIIDNNSTDNTVSKIKNLYKEIPNIKIIRLSKVCPPDIAYTAGLDNSIGDYTILFNIKFVSPSVIPTLMEKLVQGFDVVKNNSFNNQPRYSLNNLFLKIIQKLSTHDFSYEPIILLGLNRKAINSITKIKRKSRNFSYISNQIGFNQSTISFKPLKKLSKTNFPNFFELLITVADIIISNSFKPIRILAGLGMIISLFFLFYVLYISGAAILFNIYYAPKGWASLAFVIGVMFFLLFSLLTLICEYIIRILNESRNEPLYFVAEESDKSIVSISRKRLNVI